MKTWSEHLELTRPYTIAYKTVEAVENVFVYLETSNGLFGVGAGSPAEFVTGESITACKEALKDKLERLLVGRDIRMRNSICRYIEQEMPETPAARCAIDIALHDLLAKHLRIPLVDLLGRSYHSLPTSITIGIKSLEETLEEAEEYEGRGFKIIKLKIGQSLSLIHI